MGDRNTCAGYAIGKDGGMYALEHGPDHGLDFIFEELLLLRVRIVGPIESALLPQIRRRQGDGE